MESPFPEKLSSRSNVASEKVGSLVKDRLATDSAERSNPRGNRPSRNEKGDAPPPDPGYKYVFSMSFLPLSHTFSNTFLFSYPCNGIFLFLSFLADRMRDATDDDGEREKESSGQWRKDDSTKHKNRLGNHRRGNQVDSAAPIDLDEGRGTNTADKQNGRAPYSGPSRGPAQHSMHGKNSRTSPRSYNDGGNRFVIIIP